MGLSASVAEGWTSPHLVGDWHYRVVTTGIRAAPSSLLGVRSQRVFLSPHAAP